MRKKLQEKMFESSYIFELLISFVVGVGILIFTARLIVDTANLAISFDKVDSMVKILDDAIILAIGAEMIKMLCKHTPETIIEVLAFALARQLIVGHAEPLQNLITVIAIAILFAVRRFLLKNQDMVETPDGFVKAENEVQGE
ncbi:MAG: hypothetical protein IKZ25_00620 [Clostridia bacterium]|nr:hypothetical protein [Clostridia bacterium]